MRGKVRLPGFAKWSDETTKREIKSFWWAPDHEDDRWFGTLTLEPGETPHLELIVERLGPVTDRRPLGSVIHGKDEHGKPITLLFAGSSGESISGAVMKRTCIAGYAMLGIALPCANSFVAHSLRFQVQHLYGWLGISGFDRDQPNTLQDHVVRYHHPDDQWFTISPELELALHGPVQAGDGFQERRIREDAALTFRSKAGFSLGRCNELVGAVRLLLHLAVLKKVYPVWMTAYQNGHGYKLGDQWIDQDIGIWSSILREAKSEPPIPGHWVFRFDDVRSDFAGFVRKWLDYTEKFAEALNCYSSTIYHSLTNELAHLSLTQALEAYHGIQFSSHHKHTFKAKIKELCDMHAASLRGVVDNVGEFAERVLCTRNYYTHHNPKCLGTGKVAERGELFRMNEKLKLLFRCACSAIWASRLNVSTACAGNSPRRLWITLESMSQKNNTDAGSRMHVLDWIGSCGRSFLGSLNELVRPSGAVVGAKDFWLPQSRAKHHEALLSKPCMPLIGEDLSETLRSWWLAVDRPRANEPNWDLAATALFRGRLKGLVLVEAKAHEEELRREVKPKRLRADASDNSRRNHAQIGKRIGEACDALGGSDMGVNIARDSHYQFSNRIAFAWKLAKEGVPVVLIYLGFTGDEGIIDQSPCIRDDAHWRDLMNDHTDEVYPASLLEQEIPCGNASMWVLIRTLNVVRMSPPPSARKQLL